MANMTASTSRPYKGDTAPLQYGLVNYTDYQSAAKEYYSYKGAVMMIDVSDVDGYAQPLQSGITVASDDVFLGIAMEEVQVKSTDTTDGDKKITVATEGVWGFAVGSLAVTDIGDLAYASDDGTITTTTSNNLWVGQIVGVDSTYVWVDIKLAAGREVTQV